MKISSEQMTVIVIMMEKVANYQLNGICDYNSIEKNQVYNYIDNNLKIEALLINCNINDDVDDVDDVDDDGCCNQNLLPHNYRDNYRDGNGFETEHSNDYRLSINEVIDNYFDCRHYEAE